MAVPDLHGPNSARCSAQAASSPTARRGAGQLYDGKLARLELPLIAIGSAMPINGAGDINSTTYQGSTGTHPTRRPNPDRERRRHATIWLRRDLLSLQRHPGASGGAGLFSMVCAAARAL